MHTQAHVIFGVGKRKCGSNCYHFICFKFFFQFYGCTREIHGSMGEKKLKDRSDGRLSKMCTEIGFGSRMNCIHAAAAYGSGQMGKIDLYSRTHTRERMYYSIVASYVGSTSTYS